MATVYDVQAGYRAEMLDLDRRAARRMAEAFRPVYSELQRRMKLATDELERLRADPEATPLDIQKALFKSDRWRQAYIEARDELTRFNAVAKGIVTDAQGEAIDLGATHMDGLIRSTFGDDAGQGMTFARPDTEAMSAMVGFASNGGPLASLFEGIGPEALELARGVLVQGVGLGTSPVVIGRQLAGPLGLPAWRGLTIARTETLRAYREAQRQTVLANSDVLEGWVWMSARDRRTCEVCWSMDGKLFPIVEDGRVAADVPGHQAMEPGHPAQSVPTLSADEKQTLSDYTGFAYRGVNAYLRGASDPTVSYSESDINRMIGQLDTVMSRSRAEQDMTVYRGVSKLSMTGAYPGGLPAIKAGEIFSDPAYLSTALHSDGAFGGDYRFVISVPSGSRGVSVDAALGSDAPGEGEFLLPRGSNLRIDRIVGKNVYAVVI